MQLTISVSQTYIFLTLEYKVWMEMEKRQID